MQAIILAAGMGKRLKELTAGNTKCMVKVNGTTIIERALRILDRKNLSRVVIVVGYRGQSLIDYVDSLHISTPVKYIDNPIYDKTNNIYSLALAKECLMEEDTLLLESDLVFEEALIDLLLEDPRRNLALVDKYESWMDGTCMVLDEEDSIVDFVPGKHLKYDRRESYYKTVNIYKFSREFSASTYIPFLEAYAKAMGNNEYYESVIKLIAMLETKEIRAKRLNGQVWYEIDDIQDLDIAESLFADSAQKKYDAISSRYGGYWRYPKLLDFCYLVNPYYPSKRMMGEMKSNFETLLAQYPSGMRVNSLLAGKYFGVKQENIVIGNGAAELINILMSCDNGKVGFIRPTFEEYPNRYKSDKSVYMTVDNENFTYTEADIIAFFKDKEIATLVLINPDNPSGNYIDRMGILRLIRWCREQNIKLILDESFVDFADTGETLDKLTAISNEMMSEYPQGLFIVKSISKSFGIPGARLGVLASGNTGMIQNIKSSASIWNINSFGEFYMQIAEKYKNDYAASLEKIRRRRTELMEQLEGISYLRPIPSQANYIMCEVTGGKSSRELACYLLQHDIFIKDLTPKIHNGREYIRLAVRRKKENGKLVECLKAYGEGR